MTSRRRITALAVVLGLITIIFMSPPATGATTTYSSSFTRTENWYSAPLHKYFKITMTGTMTLTKWYESMGKGNAAFLGKPHIKNPTLKVQVFSDSAHLHPVTAYKLELRQYYYDRSCETRPSYSAGASANGSGAGLSIGISLTTVCQDFQTAYRASSYGSASTYTQYTSGSDVVWPNKETHWGMPPCNCVTSTHTVCVTGEYEMQPYLNTATDDLHKFRFSDICISKTYTD